MNEKTKDILSKFIGYIIIFITCILYILTAIFVLNPTGKTIGQIIGDGALAFIMGIAIDNLFNVQGIMNGMGDTSVKSTMNLYGQTIVKISGYVNKLGDWCQAKNKETYKLQRIKILARAGLKYEDCFDENGIAKTYTSNYREIPIIPDRDKIEDWRFQSEDGYIFTPHS